MPDAPQTGQLDYATYLELPTMLSLQTPQSNPAEHDEMLFIVIHQVYELWFKQILHELDLAGVRLRNGDLWGVAHVLKRVRMILKTLVSQIDRKRKRREKVRSEGVDKNKMKKGG